METATMPAAMPSPTAVTTFGSISELPQKTTPRAVSSSRTPSRLRAPRPSALPTAQSQHSVDEAVIADESADTIKSGLPNSRNTAVRRTISIGAFPHPPTGGSRPPTASSMHSPTLTQKRSSKDSVVSVRSRKPPRLSTASTVNSYRMSDSPSLLNSIGESKSVSNKRASDGVSSGASPPQSRSSSANGSYSTNATTIDETEDERGRVKDLDDNVNDSRPGSARKEAKGNVIVSVRVRPDHHGQESTDAEGEWMVDGRRALIAYRGKESADYHYDNVFGTYDDNAKVYDSAAKRLVRRVMEGYHGTVFAYGMTGTGKTFSMQGTMSSPGVIPLAITDIFSYIRETPNREFLLRVSYLEIYNEKIHDLLAAPTSGGPAGAQQDEIKLREDRHRGVYASPLKEEIVQSPTQLLRVIHRGDMARRTGSTQYNTRSSRSHAVVQIVVESRERIPAGSSQAEHKRVGMLPSGVRVSTLSLIDLAGSERAAEDKERRAEGAHINKSLLTLGTVIAKLSGKKDKNGNPMDKDGKHLPYRDSKLTRLLQPALSGNSLISILCTIQIGAQGTSATSNTHAFETLNTLKFAARAKNNIVSHAKKAAEELGGGVNAGLLERYRTEIANLRAQLETQQKTSTVKVETDVDKEAEREAEQRREEQMLEMQLARTALKERIEHLNRLILCSKSTGVNRSTSSALGMHPRISGSIGGDHGTRSVRSSASQSTLGGIGASVIRHPSMTSIGAGQSAHLSYSAIADDDEEMHGELGDGNATLQAQNRALQADLQDKNRYIATLEKRLLQARRSSHSRTSMGFSKTNHDENDMTKKIEERDAQIADLQKTVTALRSAMRQRSMAEYAPEPAASTTITSMATDPATAPTAEFRFKKDSDILKSRDSRSSTRTSSASQIGIGRTSGLTSTASPVTLLVPEKVGEKKRKSVDEMSRMLDEMIQDKVESGHLIKGRSGSVRLPRRSASARRHSRRNSSVTSVVDIPTVGILVDTLRERNSIAEPASAI